MGFLDKHIPTLEGKDAERFLEMARQNEEGANKVDFSEQIKVFEKIMAKSTLGRVNNDFVDPNVMHGSRVYCKDMEFNSVPQIWDDYNCWFIFSDDGRVSCRLSIYNENPQDAIVSDLYTHESIRKQGGAKAILDFCFDFAKDRKCNTISLRSDHDDWVRRWYQRIGFGVESSSLWLTKKI